MSSSAPQAPPHILVVEDEAALRLSFTMLLEGEGYRVSEAGDGREAMQVVERDPPDLVLSDYMMPQMNGRELIAALRARGDTAAVPVILISAIPQPAPVREGANVFMTKPTDPDAVLGHIRELLPR